jgi:hypothetical protein
MATINSVTELTKIFPELPKNSPVRKNIQKAFELGLTMEIKVCEPKRVFQNSKGQKLNTRIQIGDNVYFIKKVSVMFCSSTLEDYEQNKEFYLSIEDKPCGSLTQNGITRETYMGKRIYIESTNWMQLATIIGKNINFDLVKTCVCGRCGGEGVIRQFGHVQNGICFECLGVGKWIEAVK